jgi:hypothetical protein
MSKRLNKRQQREQDELALLQKSAVEKPEMSSEEEEEEEEVVPVPKAQAQGKVNVFAAVSDDSISGDKLYDKNKSLLN